MTVEIRWLFPVELSLNVASETYSKLTDPQPTTCLLLVHVGPSYVKFCFEPHSRSVSLFFVDGNGERGVPNPSLLRRAALVSALCLERLDGISIRVNTRQDRCVCACHTSFAVGHKSGVLVLVAFSGTLDHRLLQWDCLLSRRRPRLGVEGWGGEGAYIAV